jgi:antitoxin FitA
MGRLVQIRDVPEDVHRKLKARAAQSGMTLSEYLRGTLVRDANRVTPDELIARIRSRPPVTMPARERPALVLRRMRDRGSA